MGERGAGEFEKGWKDALAAVVFVLVPCSSHHQQERTGDAQGPA